MPERLLAPAAMAALLCLTTTAVSAETPNGVLNAEQGWSSIKRCAQEDTERARHACLDRVLQEAGLLTDDMHAQQQRRAFGLENKPARAPTPPAPLPARTATAVAPSPAAAGSAAGAVTSPEAVPAAPAASPPAKSAPPAPPAQSDRLEVELAKVEKAANGRLFVTTTDGAVWLQNETVDMPQPPVAGDRMTIRKSPLGGYRCSIATTHLTYRCVRNR